MSDPKDDREFLDEIKALEDVLANEESSKASLFRNEITRCNLTTGVRRSNLSLRGFGEVEPQREIIEVNDIEQVNSAYEINVKLIELLRETRRELVTILERCMENKAIVDEKIRTRSSISKSSTILICTAGMPYFKDSKQYPAPWNKDVKKKQKNGELQLMHLRHTCPWTAKDRNILWRAIRQEAANAVLESQKHVDATPGTSAANPKIIEIDDDDDDADNDKNREIRNDNDKNRDEENSQCVARTLNLPKNFRAMIGPPESREFDWMKIAATDFDDRHTADECRVMWRVFLHPDVNRRRWSKEEDAMMERLCGMYNYQNWDALAEELNSQRTGYQCFIRYNSINRTTRTYDKPWSEAEDDRMRVCVNKFKIGHYIPWGIVARYVIGRNKGQVYYRWTYNAAPHLKKGRFTPDEDEQLIEAVIKYGKNFSKISTCVMPNRSSVQLSTHYQTLTLRKRGMQNSWNINDDARLLMLYRKYGADWSRIASKFNGKSRTQARHRHKAILRYWEKGISLYEIPRSNTESLAELNVDDKFNVEDRNRLDNLARESIGSTKDSLDTVPPIDAELIKYFHLIPKASKPGRKRKYYRDDELEDATKMLNVILRVLDAKLVIPEDLDDTDLTERDKQLIKSLTDYQHTQTKNIKLPTRPVHYHSRVQTRNKIFDVETVFNDERHFTAVCTGECTRHEKLRWHDKIDYEPPPTVDHCQVKLTMKLHTPIMVVALIGQETDWEFDKLVPILISRKIESSRPNIGKINVSLSQACSTDLSAVRVKCMPREAENCEIVKIDNKKNNETGKDRVWNPSRSEGIIRRFDRSVSCLEPSYHTLLALQRIISNENIRLEPDITEAVLTTSEESRKSMKILKKRLIQLFKYPIGFSHILRPDVDVGGNIEGTDHAITNANNAPSIPDGCPTKISAPPTKRKRR